MKVDFLMNRHLGQQNRVESQSLIDLGKSFHTPVLKFSSISRKYYCCPQMCENDLVLYKCAVKRSSHNSGDKVVMGCVCSQSSELLTQPQ